MKTAILSIFMIFTFLSAAHALANCFDINTKLRVGDPSTPPEKCTGKLAILDWEEALKICPSGTHLPTIRELARFAKSRGAVGIIEIDECEKLRIPRYSPISYYKGSAENGGRDEFCYDYSGFTPPVDPGETDEFGHYPTYWSSTRWWMADWILVFYNGSIIKWPHFDGSPSVPDYKPPSHVWCFKN